MLLLAVCLQCLKGNSIMNHWSKRLKDSVKKKCNGILTISEYESLAQRNQEIDNTFISLYADKAKGILTEKRFLKLTDAMEKE